MTEPTELPDMDEASTDRFAKMIAIAAVLATVAAAAVGYLESQASKAADRADVDAQRLAVEGVSDLSRRREQAQVQYGLFVQGQAELRRASSALEEIRFGNGDPGRLTALELERARFTKLADRTAATAGKLAAAGGAPVLDRESPDGPDRDGLFPARYFSKSTEEGVRLTALRDAANEESADRGGQVASYVVMLAMLAVAVYLFGFSLTPHGRANRRLFAGVAAGLSVVAVLWAVVVSLDSPERAPDEAAGAFAAGRIALDLGDYEKAVRDLSRAIELRPSFARAYELRGTAEFLRGSPQVATGITSLSAPESLERAVADEQKARELGLTDVSLLGALSFNTLLLALQEDSQERFEEAVELAKEAEGRSPRNPALTFNRAVAELAAGDEDAARDSYRRAVEKVIFVDAEQRRRRNDPFLESAFVSAALTDLEIADSALGGDVEDDVRDLKEYVVRSVAAGRPLDEPQGEERTIEKTEVVMTAATALVDIYAEDLDTDSDQVSLQWYRKEGDLGWAVLPAVSAPVDAAEWETYSDGTNRVRRVFLGATAPPSCLQSGDYRVEIYINGRLAGVGESDPDDELGDLTAAIDTDIGYAVCHPPDWRPVENALPGLVNGYVNEGTTRGIFVTRVGAGGSGGAGTAKQRALRKLETVLNLLFPDEAPQRGAAEGGLFVGLTGEEIRRFTYNGGGGVIRAGYGFDVNNALFAAIVFGEPEYMDTDESLEVLYSVAER